jgi:alpha-glucosidase
LARDYKRKNVQQQQDDPFSLLSFYRRLIAIRKKEPALSIGNYRPVHSNHQLIAYTREWNEVTFLVVLNLTHGVCYFTPPHENLTGTVIVATHSELEGIPFKGTFGLGGDEGILVKLDNAN